MPAVAEHGQQVADEGGVGVMPGPRWRVMKAASSLLERVLVAGAGDGQLGDRVVQLGGVAAGRSRPAAAAARPAG